MDDRALAAVVTLLAIAVPFLCVALWVTNEVHTAAIAELRREIAALKAVNEPPRPQPLTVDTLYPENGPAYNVRD